MDKPHKPNTISLLTYNTLGVPILAPNILQRTMVMAKEMEKSSYDIVCMQEVFFHSRVSLFRQMMPSYKYCVFESTLVGPKGGLVIFSRIPLTYERYIEYARPKEIRVPWFTRLSRNGLLIAKVEKISLHIMTTHLTSEGVHHLTPENKFYQLISEQAFTAARVLREYEEQDPDIILAGDFNIAKETELYNEFLKKAAVKDISGTTETPTYYNDRINAKYNGKTSDRIDHIFVSHKNKYIHIGDEVTNLFNHKYLLTNKKESYLSDHIGLGCTITVKK